MPGYCTVQDLRGEGVTAEDANDERLESRIALASRFIELVTARWFEPRDSVLALDGMGSRLLALEIPIIAIASVRIDGVLHHPAGYRIYNRHLTSGLLNPDDRQHPRIECLRGRWYEGPVWPRGVQNITVEGTFGYTDPDPSSPQGVTPAPIRQVCMRLVLRDVAKMTDPDHEAAHEGAIRSETTRDQSVSYGAAAGLAAGAGVLSSRWTGDPAIDVVLEALSAPPRVAVV